MKKYALALTIFALTAVGCQKKNNENLASIKSDYKERVEFVLAMLNQPTAVSIDRAAYQLMMDKLNELKVLIPLSGLTVRKKVDTLQLEQNFNYDKFSYPLFDGPAYRIVSVKTWLLCTAGRSLGKLGFSAGNSLPHYSIEVNPRVLSSYVLDGSGVFNYNVHAPNYEFYPEALVVSESLYFSFGVDGCAQRSVIEYMGYQSEVVDRIWAFRNQISEVIKMLVELQSDQHKSGYPVAYQKNLISEQIRSAYNALP